MPSYNESFGLVALEAQACGTPVVAAAVGGLVTAVRDGVSGALVDGHDRDDWAVTIGRLLREPARRARLGRAAVAHAQAFSWDRTAQRLLGVYRDALVEHRARLSAQLSRLRDLDAHSGAGALAALGSAALGSAALGSRAARRSTPGAFTTAGGPGW